MTLVDLAAALGEHADMCPAETTTAPRVRLTGKWLRLVGVLLLLGAATAFLFPSTYSVLQTVGTADGRTLDAAGYEQRRGGGPVDAPRPRRGDPLLGAVMDSQEAAAQNKNAADRRSLALLLAVPGAFLVGRNPKREAG